MIISRYSLATVLWFAANQVALASGSEPSKQYSACMDAFGGVTVAMLDCIATETKHQDSRLNKAYKDVMGQISAERKQQLRQAQRLWIKYRDANCNFYFDPDGGTLATVSTNACFMSETTERANELEDFKQ